MNNNISFEPVKIKSKITTKLIKIVYNTIYEEPHYTVQDFIYVPISLKISDQVRNQIYNNLR